MNVSLLLLGAIALCVLSGCHGNPGSLVCNTQVYSGLRFKGKLVSANRYASSLASCQQKCAANPECQFYSYGTFKCDLMASDTGKPVDTKRKALAKSGYSTRNCRTAA